MVKKRVRPVGVAVLVALGVVATVGVSPRATDPSVSAAPTLPDERLAIGDLSYRGAFRLSSETFGDSNVNYAVGALGYHAANHSLFIAGHAHHNAIAEFAIPDTLGTSTVVDDLPVVAAPLQPFSSMLDNAPTGNPDGIDRINGLYVDDDQLVVNAERWYDAAGTAKDTTLVVDIDDIDGDVNGFFELDGAVHAGGYMSPVPPVWRESLGASLLTGWASNTSIISRHSVGPSLFTFEPDDLAITDPTTNPNIDTNVHMNFPHSGQRWLAPDALDAQPGSAAALWNTLSKARYGFIAPGTSTFVVVGSIGGVDSGFGYKIVQDNGNLCGGYCPYEADDVSNAYWLFDVNDILAADDVHLPRPYAFGEWSIPFDDDGQHQLIGATFDPAASTLYVALGDAGQVGTYDRPPLIVAYDVPAHASDAIRIETPATALQRADRIG